MIFVSGANGHFGRSVIENLIAAGKASSLAVGTRDVNSTFALQLAASGVSVRHADFRQPEVMRKALEGVEKALFIPTYDVNTERLQQNLNALEAAGAVGVRHVVYASFINIESQRVEHSRLVHYPTEQAILASGLDYTILRHALYADTLIGDLQDTLSTGLLKRPGGPARCAYIAREDLGASAALVLMRSESGCHIYSETMEQTYSGDEVAAIMGEVFGQPIRYVPVSATDWPNYMTENWGLPPELAKSTVGTLQALEAGEFDIVSSDYKAITGHPARTIKQFLEQIRDAGAS